MARRELLIKSNDKARGKAHTLSLDSTINDIKVKDKEKSQRFSNYLKQVARRSRAGFGKVHQELLNNHEESMMFENKARQKRMSFRKNMMKGVRNWSSSSSLPASESFKSYIEERDDRDNYPVVSRHAVSESECSGHTGSTDDLHFEAKSYQNKDQTEEKFTPFRKHRQTDYPISNYRNIQPETVATKLKVKETINQGESKSTNTVKFDETSREKTQDSFYDVPATSFQTERATANTSLYDTPNSSPIRAAAQKTNKCKSEENIYIKMGNNIVHSHFHNDDSVNYANIEDVFDMHEERKECDDYVNLKLEISNSVPPTEIYSVVEHYSSTNLTDNNTDYVNVKEMYDKKTGREYSKEKLEDNSTDNDNDYVPCDELVTMMFMMDPVQNNVAQTHNAEDERNKDIQQESEKANIIASANQQEDGNKLVSGNGEPEFYSFSVEEVVEILKICALPSLAKTCEDEHLDGAYFRSITKEELSVEPFRMNWFYISKLFRIINGWRPKRTTQSYLKV